MAPFLIFAIGGWNTHAATLTRIKDDVNKLQENTRGLQSHRTVASPLATGCDRSYHRARQRFGDEHERRY